MEVRLSKAWLTPFNVPKHNRKAWEEKSRREKKGREGREGQ